MNYDEFGNVIPDGADPWGNLPISDPVGGSPTLPVAPPTVSTDAVTAGSNPNGSNNGNGFGEWGSLARQGVSGAFNYLIAKDAAQSGIARGGAAPAYRGQNGQIFSTSSNGSPAAAGANNIASLPLFLLAGVAFLAMK